MIRKRMALAALGLGMLLAPTARAQVVGFQPVVGSFPNGAMMSATPVVSADRRYVRLTVSPQFSALEGFDSFPVPAAVGGGLGKGLGGRLVGRAGLNGVALGGAAAPAAFGPGTQASGFSSGDMPASGLPEGVYSQPSPAPRAVGVPGPRATSRKKPRAGHVARPSVSRR